MHSTSLLLFTTTHLNLFIDVNKMIYYILSYIGTCLFCFFDTFL